MATFQQSDLNYGNFNSVSLSGTNGIAGSKSGQGIFYTTNSGRTWRQSNIDRNNFDSVSLSGSNGIAGSGQGIWYTQNSGQIWQQSIGGSFTSVFLLGSNGIAGSGSNQGIWYTQNSGQTWQQTDVRGSFSSVSLSGTNGIAGSLSIAGIYYTRNSGETWRQSNINANNITSVSLSGSNGIASSQQNLGIYYTQNSGETWNQNRNGPFNSALSLSGLNGIAGSINQGIWYTPDAGVSWYQTKNGGTFRSVSLSGIYGIAGSTSNDGIWYTRNSGESWTQSSVNSGNINSVFVSGINTISGSNSDQGIYFGVYRINPTISDFSIPTKILGDMPFTIPPPTTNSTGAITYTSSNPLVANISGDIITIVGLGTSIITAIQEATDYYFSGTISTTFKVKIAHPIITDFSIPTKTYGDASFIIHPPTSDSPAAFSYISSNELVATIVGDIITIVGAGTALITATQAETENDDYTSGTIDTTFLVNKVNPIISSFSLPTKTFGDAPFTIPPPTSNSPGAFSYTSSNPLVASISQDIITIVGAGTALITATQAETNNYFSGTIASTFIVNKANPSIDNFSIPTKTFGDAPFTIPPPTSNSSGAFTYTSSNELVATIYQDIITIVGAGTALITATQAETNNYFSGTIASTFIVNKANPSIDNFSIPTKTFGDAPFTIPPPTSNSMGAFSYTSYNELVATILGDVITIVGAGTALITATQAATNNYNLAATSTIFNVNKANPSIANFSIPTKTFGDVPFTISPPTSNSAGTFNYTSSNPLVATISGNILTIIEPGTALITAIQEGTNNFNSGTTTTTFLVNKANPTISNFSIPPKSLGDMPFPITPPTSNSSGSFSYISSNPLVASISGDILTITGIGSAIITAIQEETNNYNEGTVNTIFSLIKIISDGNELLNFMNTTEVYGNIINSLQITDDLKSTSNKVLFTTNNDVKITKI